jgi:drug/metabolite transporter (DMT)-like permease
MSSATESRTDQNPATAPAPGKSSAFGMTDVGLLLMACIWGVNFSVVKYGVRFLQPMTFTAIRLSSALVVLGLVALFARDIPWPSRSDVKALLLLGVLGNGMYQFFFVTGLARSPVGVTALILASSPAWIALISRLMGRERQTSRGWTGIGLQLIGVTAVVLSTHVFEAKSEALLGTVLVIVCSLLWSLYSVLLQPYTARAHPLHLSVLTLIGGSVFVTAFALPDLLTLDFKTVNASAWSALAYSSFGAMIFAYLLYYRGIRVLGPTRTSMYSNLQPIVAIAVAWITISEAPSFWQWVGAALIMSGLLLSRTAASAKPIVETENIPALVQT